MSDWTAIAAYAYIVTAALIYAASIGPTLPRAYLASFWLLIAVGMLNMFALSLLIGDSDVSFSRGRRLLSWLRRRPARAIRGLLSGKVAS